MKAQFFSDDADLISFKVCVILHKTHHMKMSLLSLKCNFNLKGGLIQPLKCIVNTYFGLFKEQLKVFQQRPL